MEPIVEPQKSGKNPLREPKQKSPQEAARLKSARRARRDAAAMHNLLLVRTYVDLMDAGIDPPKEFSQFIIRRFRLYLNARGRLSLDQAFGLRSVQKAGNPSKRSARSKVVSGVVYEIALLRIGSQLSIPKAVDAFIAKHGGQGADFLKKGGFTLTRDTLLEAYKEVGLAFESVIGKRKTTKLRLRGGK